MSHKIVYERWTFPPDRIEAGDLHLASSLLSSSLEVNSLLVRVVCGDPAILDFQRNAKLLYYAQPDRPMIFRVQSIERVGAELYEISATSTLGLLTEGQHMGGIYTGQTAKAAIASICGTIPFAVKHDLEEIKLYGWLPIAAPRDNLAQVLFAIGAALKTDLDGVLRIESLWDGISGTADRDRMYQEAAVDYAARITRVIVIEHQYVPWTEEEQLFEGTAQAGDIITFSEPMHSLSASGFSIQASGANWARVSAGSGVLKGRKYLHNTRQVVRDVQSAQEPNIKTVEDATLVSLVNSQAVAQRLADYYKCRETVDAPVVYRGEQPGDRLATYHPFDKTGVDACLESVDITLSNTLKAQERSLVGFVPPQITSETYIDTRIVLTGRGTVQIPPGVKSIRYVLIGGAWGGRAGRPGGKGSSQSMSYSSTLFSLVFNHRGYAPGPGGKGGEGGGPGRGGRILQGTLDVSGITSLPYSCGVGGLGAVYSASNPDAEGEEGTPTTLGALSSAQGASSESGYLDIITGESYGTLGRAGLPGGDGAGSDLTSFNKDTVYTFVPSTGAVDEDGRSWSGGSTYTQSDGYLQGGGDGAQFTDSLNEGSGDAEATVGLGSGAAAGSNGTSGGPSPGYYYASRNSSKTVITLRATAKGGVKGADATLVPKKAVDGRGGTGGYGGGGGSSTGYCDISQGKSPSHSYAGSFNTSYSRENDGGEGGQPSRGGPGSDGLIILYWAQPKPVPAGQLVDRNNRMILDRLGRRIIV